MYIQGLFIFALYVLRHEKVYGKIKGKLLFSKQVSIVNYTNSIQILRNFSVCKLNVPCINETLQNLITPKSLHEKVRVKRIESNASLNSLHVYIYIYVCVGDSFYWKCKQFS